MSAIFSFEKGASKKTKKFHIFKRLLFLKGFKSFKEMNTLRKNRVINKRNVKYLLKSCY